MSDQARQAVEKAIAELDFTPSPAARSLALGRSDAIALVVPEPDTTVLADPFFARIILGLSAKLEQTDKQMVLLIARSGQSTERIVNYIDSRHVDGAVVASHHRDDRLNQRLVDSSVPCVFIGRPLNVSRGYYVDMDNAAGARLATEHLVATGRRRIATIAGPPDMSAGIDRLTGWREVLHEVGLPDEAVAHGTFTQESGKLATRRLLAEHPDLDAIFAASDLMAVGAINELHYAGRHVPDDVAVIGFDNFDQAENTDPPLSTIGHPVPEMAAGAGQMLLDLLSGVDPDPGPVLFTPALVIRKSA